MPSSTDALSSQLQTGRLDLELVRVLEEVRNRFMRRVLTVTEDLTLAPRHQVVLVDATAGPVTVTLPLAGQLVAREFTVKRIDASANAVTIAASTGDTIDGESGYQLDAQYDGVAVKSDSVSSWSVIARTGGRTKGTWQLVMKTANEGRASDTTLDDDSALTLAIPAGGRYRIRGKVFLSATDATQGYQFGLHFTGGIDAATWHRRHAALGASGTDAETTAQGSGSLPALVTAP